MKKLMSSMLAIAAMASIFSCSTEDILDQETPGTDNNGLVPIKMSAAIGGLTTKAAIGQDPSGIPTEELAVSFLRWDATTENPTAADWSTLDEPISAKIKNDGKGTIEFTPTPQYYQNNGYKTYLFGCYPAATRTADNTQLTWELDGMKDIIISDIKDGNKTTASPLAFKFEHKLALLKFNIMLPTGSASTSEQLTSITVKKQNATATYSPSTTKFTFSNPTKDMTTEGIAENTIITTSGVSGGSLLVDPTEATDGKKFEVVVATIDNGTTKEYTGEIMIEAHEKKAYDVKLIIDQKQVSGTATVGAWEAGTNPGNETIY